MRIAPENIVRHELTGLTTHIIESKDPNLACRSGVILGESKEISKKVGTTISEQGDMSRVDQIKEALESGEYKVNLQALSEKIADELL